MFLSKTGINKNVTKTSVEFELVATDLIMIAIDNDTNNQKGIYSYWRLMGNGGNPPLEVGIDTTLGTIKRIVFFLDADCVEQFEPGEICTVKGNVVVDVGIFAKQNDFVNMEGYYHVTLINGKLFCKFCENFNVSEIISNSNIEIYLDSHEQIIGFAIDKLSNSSLKMMKSLM